MLTKLLKHEFRATARIMGPLYLVLLAVALGFNFSARLMDSGNFVLNMLAALVVMAYVVAITAVFIVAFILMLQRFYKNLLGDEGYLMHTLPVTESQLILSKLISSVVWMLCSSIVGIFSFAVMLLALSLNSAALQQLPELWQKVVEIFREIFRMTGSSGCLWLIFETLNERAGGTGVQHPVHLCRLHDRPPVQKAHGPGRYSGIFPAVLPAELAELRCQQCRHAAGCFRSHPWRCRCFHCCAQCVHHPVRAGGQYRLCRRILSADPLADGA